jgi:CheY-like chemotaxis protein
VEQSADVLAYVGQVLRQAGFVVITTTNLPDALTLLTATRPKVVVISAKLRAQRETAAGASFNEQAGALRLVELPAGFGGQDAAAAGSELLDRVRTSLEAQ